MLYDETLNAIPLNAILLNDHKNMCSCTIYVVLFAIFFIISICISSFFIYFHIYFYWYLKKDNVHVMFNTSTQTTIY